MIRVDLKIIKGWSDLGYANISEAITPTIDNLARNGIILNYSYSYSMCTP